MMGIPSVNGAAAVAKSRDKLRCLQFLAQAGIPHPADHPGEEQDGHRGRREPGWWPSGHREADSRHPGIGVMIAHSMSEMQSILDTMWDLGQDIILQEYIAESQGSDVRVVVVGDQAVGAMRRTAKKGDFRLTSIAGAKASGWILSDEYASCALGAARVLGLGVGGIDLLETSSGPRVVEANSSPGFRGPGARDRNRRRRQGDRPCRPDCPPASPAFDVSGAGRARALGSSHATIESGTRRTKRREREPRRRSKRVLSEGGRADGDSTVGRLARVDIDPHRAWLLTFRPHDWGTGLTAARSRMFASAQGPAYLAGATRTPGSIHARSSGERRGNVQGQALALWESRTFSARVSLGSSGGSIGRPNQLTPAGRRL